MNLSLSDEQVLLQDSIRKLFAENSDGTRIRACEASGFDAMLWRLCSEVGVAWLRVPEASGGMGAGVHEAVLVAEQAGRYLASVPVVESIVSTSLLEKCGERGRALLERRRSLDDDAPVVVTIALNDIATHPIQVVAWAHVSDAVLCMDGARVVAVSLPAASEPVAAPVNLGSMAVREVDFSRASERVVLMEGPEASAAFCAAIEEWKLLTAAYVASGAQRAVEMAAEYAREREAFGKPIGAFQGLSHPLVDSAVDVDGARLLCWRAVDLLCTDRPKAAAMISMVLWWAVDAAGRALTKAIRVFGGYGTSLEYDVQLYFRRVTAVGLLAGDPDAQLEDAADRLWGGVSPALPVTEATAMTFDWDPQSRGPMASAREFCGTRNDEAMKRFQRESDDWYQPELYREMAQAGLLYPDWPAEFGGAGLRAVDASAIEHVIGDHGWYLLPRITTNMVGKMIIHFGSDAAKRDILPRLASGECVASLGYSEPSGGSDVFAARTRAVVDGDDWIINGQKMFTSQGHIAAYCLMIARTASDKYRGVTLFVVPLDQPGYAVNEVKTIGDERTNITFYENVKVPDAYRLGEVNGGVKVLAAALTMEQGGEVYGASLYGLLRAAVEWSHTTHMGRRPIDDPKVKRLVAELACKAEVQDVLTRRTIWAASVGRPDKSYGPMAKLFGTETLVAMSARLMRPAAPWSLLRGDGALGTIEREFRRSIASTIYAGTSEIQRSLIAESALGMPRSR